MECVMGLWPFLKAVLLGVVEGATEFLPISSTGHMILVNAWIRLSEDKLFNDAFTVFIQTGAMLAVVVLFRRELWPFAGTPQARRGKWMLWAKTLVAFLPAVVAGLLFHRFIVEHLFNSITVASALIFYGVALILFEKGHGGRSARVHTMDELTFRQALGVGLMQCLAMIPGTSRSTVTILGGMMLGLNRVIAAEFSFFLAIPTIAAGGLWELLQCGAAFSSTQWLLLGVGFAVSFLVAAVVIKWLMHYLRRHSFVPFGWYRIGLGLIVFGWWMLT
jgi:undecaprenyl-diphosphatase